MRRWFRTEYTPCTSWYGDIFAPFWDDSVEVRLHIDGTEPTDAELALLRPLLEHPVSLRDSIINAIRDFYQRLLLDGATLDISVGTYELTSEFISNSISLPSVDPNPSSMERTGDICFLMSFACTLDEEHGIDVWIVDWVVTDVGCLI